MTNLKLYVTEEDYKNFAGPDWPSYTDYITGAQGNTPYIRQEIQSFTALHKKQGIKFPINTATACQSKWTWSTLWLNELSTSSCHKVNHVPLDLEDFDNFHNVPRKLNDRQIMLEGNWPGNGCEQCRDVEVAGGFSDRQHNLGIRGLTPPELETDPLAIRVSPRIVEIFAHNTCNLSCIYCNGNLSSRIENENKKFGEFFHNGVHIPVINKPTSATVEYFEKFKNWLEKNITTLVRLHLLGGETFIQHELLNSVLDIIERHPNPNLELCIFSNLNVPDKYWNLYIDRIKDLQSAGNIRVFDLTCSIDCWGPEQEFVRHGLNLIKFEERFAWAAEQSESWLRVNVNQTITSMTIKTMPELIDKIAHYSQHRHIGHYFQFITEQHYLHPEVFAYDFWAKDFERIFKAMPTDTVHQIEAIPRMQGMQKQMQQSTQHNFEDIDRLRIYLDELDRRRNTNWRELFSYLDINE
jgi:MoaA/NifB/PqqE/SkfB family radical SAM enzyme